MCNKRRLWAGSLCVIGVMLVSTMLVAAQSPDRLYQDRSTSGARLVEAGPPDDGCDDPDADHGKKMKCKHQKLANTICETSNIANTDPDVGQVFNDKQKARFARQCEQSQAWVNAPDREEDFRRALKKGGADCYVEEIDQDGVGNDDGVCTKGEQNKEGCVEVLDDGIGDDDGVCEEIVKVTGPPPDKGKKTKKKTWETCVEICNVEEAEGGDGDVVDNQRAEMLENSLDESADVLADLNDELVSSSAALQAQKKIFNVLGMTYDPAECEGLMLFKANPKFASPMANTSYNYDTEERPFSFNAINDWRLAANYVQAGEICDDAFQFSWSFGVGAMTGGSTNAWCIVAHYADFIVQDVANGLAMLDDEITSTRIDNMAQCMQYVGVKVRTLEEGINEANEKLDETLRLLNLPPGQRPDWPGCDNDGMCASHETPENCPYDCGP